MTTRITSIPRFVFALLAVVLFIVIAVIAGGIAQGLAPESFASIVGSVVCVAVFAGALALVFVRFLRFTPAQLGLTRASTRGLATGLITGALSVALAFGLAVAIGAFELRWSSGNFALAVTALFVATFIHAFFEELAFRGGLVGVSLQKLPPLVAVSIPAVLFALGHLANSGVSFIGILNTALLGLALGVMFLPRKGEEFPSLGLATGWHVGWNFTASLCGTNVSGNERSLWLYAEARGTELFNGGVYGIEASLTTTIVGALVLGAAILRHRTPIT